MKISDLDDVKSISAYLGRIKAEPRSLRTAVVRETFGAYWKDIAVIRFKMTPDGIELLAPEGFEPTKEELQAIRSETAGAKWPAPKLLDRIIDPPDLWKNAHEKDQFVFRNIEGKIVMLQVRVERKGDKRYVPITYWDDEVWRHMEPEGPLPLYNEHLLKDASTVFIHEGAKAAKYCQWIVDRETPEACEALANHPWGPELSGTVHLGWIGGALSPYRTNWSIINQSGARRVFIVADNDPSGKSSVPDIAQQLRVPTFSIEFWDEWPGSFDLADPFPEKMFNDMDGARYYIGPGFRDCVRPATWATDLRANAKGKPTPVLRDAFRDMWAYVEEAELYVCLEIPTIRYTEKVFNNVLSAFSHTSNTTALLNRKYKGKMMSLGYNPGFSGLIYTDDKKSKINLHTPTTIRAVEGDAEPWLALLKHLFPSEREEREVARWCATLIARPDIRMEYALLLVSERQGIGKTTLAATVLAPLVGMSNVSFPSESDIVNSDFTGWIANKRLIIVSEIYAGHSWKAYNKLKSHITDLNITVNEKYQKPYQTDNWAHIIASSNSRRALKMEDDDRRWFYPKLTEDLWPRDKWTAFRSWLAGGGHSIIKAWAQEFDDYVQPGERAPMTELKKEAIEDSLTDHQKDARAIAQMMADHEDPVSVSLREMYQYLKANASGRMYDREYEIKRAMQMAGLKVWDGRLKIRGRMDYVLYNDKLDLPKGEESKTLREHLNAISGWIDGDM